MTTIAWDGEMLVGDTLCCSGGTMKRQCCKVWRLTDGRLYGGSGNYEDVLAVKAWLEAGEPPDKKPVVDDFAAILVDKIATCYRLEKQLIPMEVFEPYHAVGSGRDFAIAAMFLGSDARRAVEVAGTFDVYTGMETQAIMLKCVTHG